MTPPLLYIAGPLFNTHERWYLERITQALEAAGYRTFLPHREAGLLIDELTLARRTDLFRADLAALDRADAGVALLTGADHDSGTSAELGYLFARGRLCFGITDDRRWLNNILWGLCGEGQRLAATVDELVGQVQAALPLAPPDA